MYWYEYTLLYLLVKLLSRFSYYWLQVTNSQQSLMYHYEYTLQFSLVMAPFLDVALPRSCFKNMQEMSEYYDSLLSVVAAMANSGYGRSFQLSQGK